MEHLVSALEMAELDRQTIEELSIPGRVLMETAGRAVAEACVARLPVHGRVVVAAGPGNNGGDGYVIARILLQRGYEVRTFVFAERGRLRGDAEATLLALEKANVRVEHVLEARGLAEFASAIATADLVVDALLGVGLTSEVRGTLAQAISILNDARRPVLAVDIPSGVDANTGAVLGCAVQATATVTFAFAKRGHYLFPGAELRGGLTVVDIGIPRTLAGRLGVVGHLLQPADLPRLVSPRSGDSHKGTFGTAVVVAGSKETPGAAVLASLGALRSGAGLVRWATDADTLVGAPPRPADLMLLVREPGESSQHWADRILENATAVVVGPGLSTAPARAADLSALLASAQVPLLIDADGLNLMAADPGLWKLAHVPVVITPHPKELARLTGRTVQELQRDRFAAAMQLAVANGCVVVLKGAGTVIAEPDGTVTVLGAGNPGLATGGTGDVLAGLIGGLLAQGLQPAAAAQAGALVHAMAGDLVVTRTGQAGLNASDLPGAIGEIWSRHAR